MMNKRLFKKLIFLPFFLVICSGLILQLKELFDFIEPHHIQQEQAPFEGLVNLKDIHYFANRSYKDIDRVVYEPNKFSMYIDTTDGERIFINPQTGYVLKRSHPKLVLFKRLHSGEFFGGIWIRVTFFFFFGVALLFFVVRGFIYKNPDLDIKPPN